MIRASETKQNKQIRGENTNSHRDKNVRKDSLNATANEGEGKTQKRKKTTSRNIARHAVGLFSFTFFSRYFLRPPPVPLIGAVSRLFLGPLPPQLMARCRLASSSSLCQEVINLSAPCSTPACTVAKILPYVGIKQLERI